MPHNASHGWLPAWRRAQGLGRGLGANQSGQATVEYMVAVLFLAVVMAAALPELFGALSEFFNKMGAEFSKPYP